MDFSNKADIKALDADIRAALLEVAQKHGVNVRSGGGTFDPAEGTFKPKVLFSAPNSAERTFAAYCRMFNLQPEDFGKSFTTVGRTYTISGLNPRASKRPVLAKCEGKEYAFTPEGVAALLGGAR